MPAQKNLLKEYIYLSFGHDKIDSSLKKVEKSLGLESKYFKKVISRVQYFNTEIDCKNCNFKGLVASGRSKAHKIAEGRLQKKIIDDLEANGYKIVSMERALRLPFGTMKKWRAGKVEDVSLALLKLIKSMPWLINVADYNFSEEIAKKLLLEEYQKIFESKI